MVTVIKIVAIVLVTTATAIATTGAYKIPISLNPLIQSKISHSDIMELFYNKNVEFYSKVTLTDVADNTAQSLKDIIAKKLIVVFLTTVSSYLAKTLTLKKLKFNTTSRWSYNVSVDAMINASNGNIISFTQNTELFRFQEMAMKVLENRYSFNSSVIRNKLDITMMEFLAANKEQWIDIVGAITHSVINSKSEKLNLTPCYLAELLNKTLNEINGFTLNEVDLYLYNTSILVDKLPAFQNTTLTRFYESFNITPTEMANDSNVNVSVIQSMGLKDLIQLFTKITLQKFRLSQTDISNKYQKSAMDISFPCPDEWSSFEVMVVQEAFENEARNMSITNVTLSSLIQIPFENVKTFSFQNMQQLIENVVKPAKKHKEMIEQTSLYTLTNTQGTTIFQLTKDNALDIIKTITNFVKRQLSILYQWTNVDYQFAEMFPVADLVESCSSDVYSYTLLTLANVNFGKVMATSSCKSLAALRAIWNKATISTLKNMSGSTADLPNHYTIENVLHLVTNSSSKFIFRVLNISTETQELCSNISLYHISLVTLNSVSHLMKMSFQDVINLVIELNTNGSLYRIPISEIANGLTSPTMSSETKEVKTHLKTFSTSQTYATTIQNMNITNSLVGPNMSSMTMEAQTRLNNFSLNHTQRYATTIPNMRIAKSLARPNMSSITMEVQTWLKNVSLSHTHSYARTIKEKEIMSLPSSPITNSWINSENISSKRGQHTRKSENHNWSTTIIPLTNATKTYVVNSSEKTYISKMGISLCIIMQTIYQWA